MKDISNYLIHPEQSVREALGKLNSLSGGAMTLFVVDSEQHLVGAITDGDIRRNLLKGKNIDEHVSEFMFTTPFFLRKNDFGIEEIRRIKEKKYELIPVVDEVGKLMRIIDFIAKKTVLPLHAVIMAGGKGMRLRPLTERIPKPLLKVGDKPILEHNIDRLSTFGIGDITISLNYLGDQIRDYFGSGIEKSLSIDYVDEGNVQLGTLGAVSLMELNAEEILIMNSDLLTNIDFEDMYATFKEKEADMLVAAIPYDVKVPYAVLRTDGELITSFEEKPTYTYYSNAGIYIVKRTVLSEMPSGEFYNATDLMEDLIKQGKRVCYFPILGYWLDIGKHEDYQKAQIDIKHIRL